MGIIRFFRKLGFLMVSIIIQTIIWIVFLPLPFLAIISTIITIVLLAFFENRIVKLSFGTAVTMQIFATVAPIIVISLFKGMLSDPFGAMIAFSIAYIIIPIAVASEKKGEYAD